MTTREPSFVRPVLGVDSGVYRGLALHVGPQRRRRQRDFVPDVEAACRLGASPRLLGLEEAPISVRDKEGLAGSTR
jgi:hypothetical protein